MLRWAEKRNLWRGLMMEWQSLRLIDVEALLDPDYEVRARFAFCHQQRFVELRIFSLDLMIIRPCRWTEIPPESDRVNNRVQCGFVDMR